MRHLSRHYVAITRFQPCNYHISRHFICNNTNKTIIIADEMFFCNILREITYNKIKNMNKNQKKLNELGKYVHFYLKDNDDNLLIFIREYVVNQLDNHINPDLDICVKMVNYSNLLIKLTNSAINFKLDDFINDFSDVCNLREYIWEDYYDYLEENEINFDIKQFNSIKKIIRNNLEYLAEKYKLKVKVIAGNKFNEKLFKTPDNLIEMLG